jgi:hypothetical protein
MEFESIKNLARGYVRTRPRPEIDQEFRRHHAQFDGMVQKRPFSGNTWDLSADPDRSRVGAGLFEPLIAVLGLQLRENRVYPRSSSQ